MSDIVGFMGFIALFFGALAVADLIVRAALMLPREPGRMWLQSSSSAAGSSSAVASGAASWRTLRISVPGKALITD